MRRLFGTVVLGMMVAFAGQAAAGQKQVPQTPQLPPLTTEQMVMDCTITGVLFSVATGLGLLKPMTVALHTMPSLLHEAIYGCGIGVISGYVGQSLMSLMVLPPAPSPFDPPGGSQNNAMLPQATSKP